MALDPDTVWAPSWVVWRTGPEWIGWAPLPPQALWTRGELFFNDHDADDIPWHAYSFCRWQDFNRRHLHEVIVDHEHNAHILNATRPWVHHFRTDHDRIVEKVPINGQLEQVTGQSLLPHRYVPGRHPGMPPEAEKGEERRRFASPSGQPPGREERISQPPASIHPSETSTVIPVRPFPPNRAVPVVEERQGSRQEEVRQRPFGNPGASGRPAINREEVVPPRPEVAPTPNSVTPGEPARYQRQYRRDIPAESSGLQSRQMEEERAMRKDLVVRAGRLQAEEAREMAQPPPGKTAQEVREEHRIETRAFQAQAQREQKLMRSRHEQEIRTNNGPEYQPRRSKLPGDGDR